MKSEFSFTGNLSNLSFAVSCNLIQKASDEFCRMIGFSKKDILHKPVYDVMRKLLRMPEGAARKVENGEGTAVILFTKTLQAKEVELTSVEKVDAVWFYVTEKNTAQSVDGFGLIGKMLADNVYGVGVFAAKELILLKANERFLSLLDPPYQNTQSSLGKSIKELTPWTTLGHAEEMWIESISLGKSFYGKEIKGKTGRWKDRYCNVTIIPITVNGCVKFITCVFEDVTENVLIRENSEKLARTVLEQNTRLKKKNALLSTVVEKMTDGVVIFDSDRNYLLMNKIARELFAVGDEPLKKIGDMSRNVQLFDKNGEQMAPEQYASNRLLRGEKVNDLHMTIERAGRERYTEVSGVPICGDNGEFLAGFIYIRDITEQKKERELAAAMDKIRGLVHSTLNLDGLLDKTLIEAAKAVGSESAAISLRQDGQWVVRNVYGFSKDVIGLKMDDKLEPHSLLAINTKKPVIIEDTHIDKRVNHAHMKNWNIRAVIVVPLIAGEEAIGVMYFNFHKSAMRFSQAMVEFAMNLATALSVAMQNIRLYEKVCAELSIQEQLREELQKEKNRMEAVIENMSDALFIIDANGNNTILNKTAREYHMPIHSKMPHMGEHQSAHFIDSEGRAIPPEDTPTRRVMRGEKLVGYKMKIQTPERVVYSDISGTPLYDEGGNVVAGVICSRDETEHVKMDELLKKQNRRLEEALKMKDEFLTLLSHEFKTPITVVNAAVQAIENLYAHELSDNAKRFVKIIKQNQYRQLRLVNNLLEVARMNAGQAKITLKNCDIVGLTGAIVESVQLYAQEKKVNLAFSSAAVRKIVALDEEKYEKIVLNLLSNAIKFTRAGGRIWVQLSLVKGSVEIAVKDEGIGISKEKLPMIFERFAQADSLLSRRAEGTGVGLNLVKLYTQLLGGTVTVKSKERKGSIFTVKLPDSVVMEEPQEEEADSAEKRLGQNTAIEFSDLYLG